MTWRNAVVYEVYVRSFKDGNGDGVGDLGGLRSRLPYVRDLGVDAVWITPSYPTSDLDHGYDVTEYCDVDPRFGTPAQFEELLADAHALGLRVLVDLVPNHTSSRHPWFVNARRDREHPHRQRYVWAPGREDGSLPNNWTSVFGGRAWSYDDDSDEWYLHLFAAFGFTSAEPWLPMPPEWEACSVEFQERDPDSTLNLYRRALRLRRSLPAFGDAAFRWLPAPRDCLVFSRGSRYPVVCAVNMGESTEEWSVGNDVLLASGPGVAIDGDRLTLPPATAVWVATTGSRSPANVTVTTQAWKTAPGRISATAATPTAERQSPAMQAASSAQNSA